MNDHRNSKPLLRSAIALLILAASLIGSVASAEEAQFDLVLRGGRVMDPESGLDAIRNVGIRDGKIAAISEEALNGADEIDVTNLVVAPGFIDLHAHGQENVSNAFQAQDGVTTAFDLELGSYPVETLYEQRSKGAVLNYGVSVGHIPARIKVMSGIGAGHVLTRDYYGRWYLRWLGKIFVAFKDPLASTREPASDEQIDELVKIIGEGLDAGGVGIGFGLDYVPGSSDEEIRRVFQLAADRGVPCLVHMSGGVDPNDLTPIDTIIEHAEATGASLHLFHITSSAQQRLPQYLGKIEAARARGLDVTTEMYPYTRASTGIETAMFDEGFQERKGIDYNDIIWPPTGERMTEESFKKFRKQGGVVVFDLATTETVETAVADPNVMIASDGLPMFLDGTQHPRGVGTFARVLGKFVREEKKLTLMKAIEKMTLMPARRLETFVPAMRDKGRLRVGADADITVFDPETVIDRATYKDPRQASDGIPYVMVNGTFVVRDGTFVPDVFPGRPIRASK